MNELNLSLGTDVSVSNQLFPLVLLYGLVLSALLRMVYIKFSMSIAEKKVFSLNLIFLTLITTLIITAVKSSLALSLGLVGALSIVRFRTAIKNPEELIFLFFALAIGVGLGANQLYLVTSAFIIFVSAYIFIGSRAVIVEQTQSSISIISDDKIDIREIYDFLIDQKIEMSISFVNLTNGTKLEMIGHCSYKQFDLLSTWVNKRFKGANLEYFARQNSD
jgi:hypothetical protein